MSNHAVEERQSEFGRPDHVVFVGEGAHPADSAHGAGEASASAPAPSASPSSNTTATRPSARARLRRNLFQPRHLHQYWLGDTLFRTAESRHVTGGELFLDLVLVGGIAALGHHLRAGYEGWRSVESFLLLFGAVYNAWRAVVLLWNLWGIPVDLIGKATIYALFTLLAFISLGSHGAYGGLGGRYVAVSAFLASALPTTLALVHGIAEPLLHSDAGAKALNHTPPRYVFLCAAALLSYTPYLAAACLPQSAARAARVLYWAAFLCGPCAQPVAGWVYDMVTTKLTASHKKTPNQPQQQQQQRARVAVNVELYVEKFSTFTMIVLGESVLGILFEGSEFVTSPSSVARLATLFASAAAMTAMLYATQTLYVDVDGRVLPGGLHAVLHRRANAAAWTLLHVPYHAALVLLATGLGIAVRDIGRPSPLSASVKSVVERAAIALLRFAGWENIVHATAGGDDHGHGGGAGEGGQAFGVNERWLFSAGWGVAMVLSAIISMTHKNGPKTRSKLPRVLTRCVLATTAATTLPLADRTALAAESFIVAYAALTVIFALAEFVLVEMDKVDFFRQGQAPTQEDEHEEDDDAQHASETEQMVDAISIDSVQRRLRERLGDEHEKRLVRLRKSQSGRERHGGFNLG